MATRRRGGLDDDQVAKLRQDVADGRRPRVAVSGGQFPDGTTGTVVRVGAADADGAEFITVRVKAGSVTDELGFAPSELALPQRGTASRGATSRGTASRGSASSGTGRRARAAQPDDTTARPVAADAAPPSRPVAEPVAAPQAASAQTAPPQTGSAQTGSAQAESAQTGSAQAGSSGKGRPKAAAAPRRGGSAPAVSITIASAGVTWTVSATRGARSVVKKAPLAPGVVTAVAALLELPEIDEAVTAVNGAALDEAEARAARLRAELAEIEAVLVSHRPPHG